MRGFLCQKTSNSQHINTWILIFKSAREMAISIQFQCIPRVGMRRESIAFSFDTNELTRYLDKLEIALLRSGKKHRELSKEEKQVREFGEKLFRDLFTQEIRSCYDRSMTLALAQQKEGLRIRLNIQDNELSALPWEYMFDQARGIFYVLPPTPPLSVTWIAVRSSHPWRSSCRSRYWGWSPADPIWTS